ncbi:AMP-binding protein [Paraburkholderia caballeronis]|uniref:Acyl-CoA synthetase (AMP-forming)/AMP-acid ligase II n=1 Tax=Paraburkholderia caballeronis TaxID=416943 RepID=A0A1H7G8H1_9BURK|nr:AMP-binding protein [Paraburkholderia caballeronis]PXW24749.1 acyl-CoA synthetase (AMP-forming)/AMP-acid ligase II [Paraburkholderia caballeronis]PXX00479.1 acyl-CoA synthetase (AMP-forming)/AMP-acid ligase II [Paraburkholderia caballeronis]RAJ98542.1 acyl-CoA synthetase (AMP-forming)/AMP-acid ligase II [Paraburkholderia caballeronis]SEE66435.1 Acyl-CoA synthetase (AMP-forming)/AMP-acid ligase II [Paraburkholderia caballeronis]SEK32065.1 Acyl-CoA synthetase (AMP-forming)/AMP-acid ligase II 
MIHLRIGDIVAHNARVSPDAPALIEGERIINWRALDLDTNRIANALASLGLKKGTRVATVIRNGAAAVETIFALAKAGVLAVPVNYGLTPAEIAVLLDDSQPHAIVVDAEFLPALADVIARPHTTIVVRGDAPLRDGWLSLDTLVQNASDAAPEAGVEPDDIRTIRYTSGTTAAPKGCLGTHRQILSSIDNFLKQVPVPESGPFLQMLPLFSGAGIWMSVAAAYHGVANVLMPDFNPQVVLNAIAAHGVVHTCGVPTMVSRLTEELRKGDYAIGSLKLFGYTGAKMPPATIRRALDAFDCDFYQGFGGGEMGGLVSYLMPDDHRAALNDGDAANRLASVGRPAGYAEICIRSLKDGTPLPANEPGEITVRSASNFSGYLNRPDDTTKTLRGEWVYTGDVGYLDDDGYLYAVDRAKDMVVTGGMNVSSAEVEAVLSEHPAVKSVAVIGLPSEEWGEAVTAIVVLREEGGATPTELMQFARQRLAGYKSPKAVHFVSEFPLNSVGKVLKRELRDQFATASQD